MNYIQEINEFYDWLELHNLSKTAIALWYALMHMNNKARWAASFTVSMRTLEMKTGIKASELFKARTELTQLQRIRWKERGGCQCASYQVIPFISNTNRHAGGDASADAFADAFRETNSDACRDTNGDAFRDTNSSAFADPFRDKNGTTAVSINKQTVNDTKQDQNSSLEPQGSMSSADDEVQKVKQVFDLYNAICRNLPPARMLTEKRHIAIRTRLREYGYDNVLKVLHNAAGSDFMSGANPRNWTADIEWIFRPNNFPKVLENKFRRRPVQTTQATYGLRPSPLELIEEAYLNITGNEECDQINR